MPHQSPTIGFPVMQEEPGERRAFLPNFIHQLAKLGFEIFLEKDYGLQLEFKFADYQMEVPNIHTASREEIFLKDYVIILRSPHYKDFDLVGEDSCLLSMLHFPTRPLRIRRLKEKTIKAISLDSIVNDLNVRLVENMQAVAWNGIETVFGELGKNHRDLIRVDGKPWQVFVLGTGMVGRQAVNAATKFGRNDWNRTHIEKDGSGVQVIAGGRNLSRQKKKMLSLLRNSHVIVDCTQRKNASKPVIPNEWLEVCHPEAIIADLSVDPYTLNANPPVVKGIEGIPQGNLDQYIFETDDPRWEKLVPDSIPTNNRRKTATCYSWPGIYPKKCMRIYGQQLLPLMRVLRHKNYDTLSSQGSYFERALYRARLDTFLEQKSINKSH